MKKTIIIGIIALAGVIAIIGLRGSDKLRVTDSGTTRDVMDGDSQPEDSQTFDKAPDFSLEDFDGNTVRLADFAGTPVVLNTWAAWCPFCRKELPAFSAVQKEFGDQVVIISIDRAESRKTAKKYTDELGVTNDFIFLLDPDDSFYRSIGGFSMPETLFVDASGNIRVHKRGPMDTNEIREKVQRLIDVSKAVESESGIMEEETENKIK